MAQTKSNENNFATAFVTRSPFRRGLLDLLRCEEVQRLYQACGSLWDDYDRQDYLEVVGNIVGDRHWARRMKKAGYTVRVLGPADCDTGWKFLSLSRRGGTIVLVTSDEDGRILCFEDIVEHFNNEHPTLAVGDYREGVQAFFDTKCCLLHAPEKLMFHLPHRAALTQDKPWMLNWRSDKICLAFSPNPVFNVPVAGIGLSLLHPRSVANDAQIEQVVFRRYDEEQFKTLSEYVGTIPGEAGSTKGKTETKKKTKRIMLVFKPFDWGLEYKYGRKVIAAVVEEPRRRS